MKKTIIVVTCFLLNLFVVLNVYASEEAEIKSLLAIEIADWNHDGSMDKAVLALPKNKNDDGATLYIFLSNKSSGTIIKKRNIAWFGAMWGTVPKLSINKSGSLIIHSMNNSIGRNRWSQKLVISYRKKQFIISGYNYSSYDTLQRNSRFECDVNMLTGKGKKNGKSFRVNVKIIPLLKWNDEKISKECNQ